MTVEHFHQISNFSIHFILQLGHAPIDFVHAIFRVANSRLNLAEFTTNDGGLLADFYTASVGYFLNVACGMVFFVDDVTEAAHVAVTFRAIKLDTLQIFSFVFTINRSPVEPFEVGAAELAQLPFPMLLFHSHLRMRFSTG